MQRHRLQPAMEGGGGGVPRCLRRAVPQHCALQGRFPPGFGHESSGGRRIRFRQFARLARNRCPLLASEVAGSCKSWSSGWVPAPIPSSFAVSYWGGAFYVFTSETDDTSTRVDRFSPEDRSTELGRHEKAHCRLTWRCATRAGPSQVGAETGSLRTARALGLGRIGVPRRRACTRVNSAPRSRICAA